MMWEREGVMRGNAFENTHYSLYGTAERYFGVID